MGIKPRALPNALQELEMRKFDKNAKNQAAVRVMKDSRDVNKLEQEITTVGTSAVLVTLPEAGTQFEIFHQHETAKVYFGDASVSSSGYPYLEFNDSLSLEVKGSTEVYMISDTADVEVFALSEVKE